ncbi:MAG: ABC transporter substrate-binding protein [Methyloceanibacter sp.]
MNGLIFLSSLCCESKSISGQPSRAGDDDLAVDAINAKGGVTVGGKRYELVIKYYDDESTPARCTELAERLIRQDGVKFVLGPYSSGLTKAMLPIIENIGCPWLREMARRESCSPGAIATFSPCSPPPANISGVIELAAENAEKLGKPPAAITVAFAMGDDPFAQDVRAGVLDDIKRHGMKVVIDDQLPPELNDMSATLAKVKAPTPDLLVVSGHEKGAMTAVTQIKALLALTHCNSAQIAEKLGEASEHAFCAGQWHQSLNYRG